MKRLFLLIPILSLTFLLSAQSDERLSVELDMARVARPHGLFDASFYSPAVSLLNGARLLYEVAPRWNAFFGVRRLPFGFTENGGFTRESGEIIGLEARLGVLLSPRAPKRLSLNYGLEIFGELAEIEGDYVSDAPPAYEMIYQKYYLGVAPSLLLRLALTQRLSLVADTRFQIGQAFFRPLETRPVNQAQFVTTSYTMSTWNPLNSLALRISL